MLKYTLQRLVYMIITLFIIATVTFFLMKLLPGSPFKNQEKLKPEQIQILNKKYGLDKPVSVQYINYMKGVAKLDFGVSFQYNNRPVKGMILDRFTASARLGLQSILFGTIIGLFLGIIAAIKHNTWVDYLSTFIAVLGVSIPSFVFAGLLQYFVAVKLGWFPVAFWEDVHFWPFWTGFEYTVLPMIALSVFVISTVARFMRTEMIEVMGSDYIVLAKAKGISYFNIVMKHGVRNALIPVITILGPLTVSLVTGSMVIENIFAIPGLGEQFVRSINTNDYPTIMGTTLFLSALFIFVVFVIDILYGIVDPRIRLSGGSK